MADKFIQCSTKINKSAVRREVIDGVEHVIVSSFTLPDNIVMNGLLYPADEIAKGFNTLEQTLAPIEHPQDKDGNFISANTAYAINNFYAGAYNVNVTRADGRVHIEKFINVQEAMKTDRGKRLMDRVCELETNPDARPIHTSVGVWIDVEPTQEVMTNDSGLRYNGIARSMVFDHDAILLDSVGAAQPHQGVGIAVNADGQTVDVDRVVYNDDPVTDGVENASDLSHDQIRELLYAALNSGAMSCGYINEIYSDHVIFECRDELFSVPYRIDGEQVTITGIPLPVVRDISYSPKTNKEGDTMKELMLKALAAAGITVNAEISDADLLAKYNELLANQDSNNDGQPAGEDLATVVTNAVAPLMAKIEALEANQNAAAQTELNALVDVVVNSGKFAGLDADGAKALPMATLKSMAANCKSAHGLPLFNNESISGGQDFSCATEMPE